MTTEQRVKELTQKLKAEGSLKLYWVNKCHIGHRDLHWVNARKIKVTYMSDPKSIVNLLDLGNFLKTLVMDGEDYENYWHAYARQLRLTAKEETTI